ncbi:MAG: hypothetical protein AAGH40_08350 [Verrucomicrobiota bacterium]
MKVAKFIAWIIMASCSVFSVQASPASSASFQKTLEDAEMIASLDPAWKIYRTVGKSMGNYFGDHSLILVQETAFEDIREQMIVVYRNDSGELISHQVIAKKDGHLQTKGYANLKKDPVAISEEMVLGTVFCVFHSEEAPKGPLVLSNGRSLPTALCKEF